MIGSMGEKRHVRKRHRNASLDEIRPAAVSSIMEYRQALIDEIDRYCAEAGIAPATLTTRAGQGGRFYKRLTDGKRVFNETIDAVRRYMVDNPPQKPTDVP